MRFLYISLTALALLQFSASTQAAEESAPVPVVSDSGAGAQPVAAYSQEAETEVTPPSGETGEEYDVTKTIERGKEIIRAQKEQLMQKEPTKEEKQKVAEEEAVDLRREVYQQQIIQEVEYQSTAVSLENELMRERFRQEIMIQGGRQPARPAGFKKQKFQLRLSEACDDNIYLDKTDAKKDYITKISPSFLFSANTKHIMVDANYAVDYTYYASDKNRKQDGFSHLLYTYIRPGATSFPFLKGRGGKFGIEIQNTFEPRITNIPGGDQTVRETRKYNKFVMPLDYYMTKKLTLSMEYVNVYERYIKPEFQFQGSTDNSLSPKVFFHIRPKWSLFAGYTYGIRDYPKFAGGDGDSDYHRVSAGLTGILFTKVRSRFELGNEWRNWKSSIRGDTSKMFFKASLVNKFSSSTKGLLQYNHLMQQTTNVDPDTPYYIYDSFYVDLEHKLTNKLRGILGFNCYQNNFDRPETISGDTKVRRDRVFKPQIGFKYYFKQDFFADLYYTYTRCVSTFSANDYTDNKLTAGLNVPF
ncbi:MAG: outer membrane beta-barrel protein [Candidatus Omnitrophica bacterium]|nr:outer membrane beta-barrel protein [Candidatus Omnitrophota bacterium]